MVPDTEAKYHQPADGSWPPREAASPAPWAAARVGRGDEVRGKAALQ